MNKMLIYFICLSIYQVCSAQEFSFVMHFEDARGNRDSIEIGYDIDASEGMDSLFDEQNIMEIKWDSVFDV